LVDRHAGPQGLGKLALHGPVKLVALQLAAPLAAQCLQHLVDVDVERAGQLALRQDHNGPLGRAGNGAARKHVMHLGRDGNSFGH
jgi:hypothetical protein